MCLVSSLSPTATSHGLTDTYTDLSDGRLDYTNRLREIEIGPNSASANENANGHSGELSGTM